MVRRLLALMIILLAFGLLPAGAATQVVGCWQTDVYNQFTKGHPWITAGFCEPTGDQGKGNSVHYGEDRDGRPADCYWAEAYGGSVGSCVKQW